jgi:dipeptidyl aminopeptidase/acylaminoacyl peptidase
LGDASPSTLFELNPQVKDWEMGKQEVVHWKNAGGEDLEGILIKPFGYQPGHRYPLIVDCYPVQGNSFKGHPMMGNQAWASRGYAVFIPSPRGPHVWMAAFKSRAYNETAKGPRGWEVTFEDVISGVDDLIRQGIVDPERMGLYGFSNGGAVVEQIVTRTGRFKCAVAVAAAISADWMRGFFLHTDDPLIPDMVGMTPWDNPQAYVELSAVYTLNKVTTPMLLADGDQDDDFLLDGIEVYNGLRWLKKPVTFVRYPDQGHGFTGAALQDFWQRELEFFNRYLKPPHFAK